MFSTLLTVALFVAPAIQGALAEFAISTPELTQCQEAKISWEPTDGPYFLYVVDPKDPCGDAFVEAGEFDGTSLSWKAAVPAGMTVQLYLEDSKGDEAWSGPITVKASDDASCVAPELAKQAAADNKKDEAAAPSASNSASPSGTTLVVPPANNVKPSPSPSIAPIGAANAGTNPFSDTNAALTMRQVSTPLMTISALIAVLAIAL